ncbi:MAG: hypothetical protein ABEJ55_08480 [Halanaeroarchaeum sp.]
MTLPAGPSSFDRVVTELDLPLAAALDRSITGYLEIVPQAALLLDASGSGVIWVADGVPTHASHTGTGATGPSVLADIAATGPFRVRIVALDDGDMEARPADASLSPGAPAERLAGDDELAERTRRRAGEESISAAEASGIDAVETFLRDDEKIRAIREHARAEAERKADEWGFGDLE